MAFGPKLFLLYTADLRLTSGIQSHGLCCHLYAVNTFFRHGHSLYLSTQPTQNTSLYVVMANVWSGSVLGPLLFVLYTADLASLIDDHRLHPHLNADETQVYRWCRPTDVNLLQASTCIDDVWSWRRSTHQQAAAKPCEE